MHTFNYLFLKNCRVDSILLNRISNLERLREKTVEIEYRDPNLTSAMEKRAILMSVVDSNAIEGIYTSEGRINGLISGRTAPRGHNEEEILGYRDVLRYIHSNHKKINLNKETLLEIYSMLMFHTETEDLGFKTRDNVIAERDADGTLLMLHRTVPAEKTEWCIDQLLGAFWEARNDLAINKLLLIPCFIMDFLRIHPFIDGNGRMSRLLTTLLLYQEGYDICKFTSMESKINSSKNQYYDSLAQSEEGWWDNDSDYQPFISYFLDQLFLCYRELDLSIKDSFRSKRKSGRIDEYLKMCILPVSKKELCDIFPEISETTIERTLKRLLDSGIIEAIGSSRSTRYIRKNGKD